MGHTCQATNQNLFLAQAKGDSHLKIWALQELNILQFLDGEYYRNSPALVELINTVRERSDIALALNTVPKPETESKKENIEFLRSLFDSIGIKLAKPVRKLINGVRERVYCVDDPAMQAPARLEVLSAIARKFDNYLESEAVTKVNWEEARSCLSWFMVSHPHWFICCYILPELVYLPKVDAPT